MRFFRSLRASVQAVLCLIGALVFLTGSDTLIKLLSPHYALHEVMLFRNAICDAGGAVDRSVGGGMDCAENAQAMVALAARLFFSLGQYGIFSRPLGAAAG